MSLNFLSILVYKLFFAGKENRKAKALKILALKTAAFLKWDADMLNEK